MDRKLVGLVVLALGCSREPAATGASPPPEVRVAPTPTGQAPDPAASASRERSDATPPALEDWILARLRVPKRQLAQLGSDTPDVGAERYGVVAADAFRVEDPAMWLLVYAFANQARANEARDAIVKALEMGPPHSIRTSITGAYLLVIGFASHKPVSAEMEHAQTEYLSAFAGEE